MNAQDFFLRTKHADSKMENLFSSNLIMSNEEIGALRFLRADIFRNGCHVRVSTRPLWLSRSEKKKENEEENLFIRRQPANFNDGSS